MDERGKDDGNAPVVVEPGWERQVRTALDNLRKSGLYDRVEDTTLAERLRHETLVGFNRLVDAALSDGHPEFLLRALRSSAQVSGLASAAAQINVNVGAGGSESLPSLAHLTDEELVRMSLPQTLPSLPRRERRKKRDGGADGKQ